MSKKWLIFFSCTKKGDELALITALKDAYF